jgi:hypothetical protein
MKIIIGIAKEYWAPQVVDTDAYISVEDYYTHIERIHRALPNSLPSWAASNQSLSDDKCFKCLIENYGEWLQQAYKPSYDAKSATPPSSVFFANVFYWDLDDLDENMNLSTQARGELVKFFNNNDSLVEYFIKHHLEQIRYQVFIKDLYAVSSEFYKILDRNGSTSFFHPLRRSYELTKIAQCQEILQNSTIPEQERISQLTALLSQPYRYGISSERFIHFLNFVSQILLKIYTVSHSSEACETDSAVPPSIKALMYKEEYIQYKDHYRKLTEVIDKYSNKTHKTVAPENPVRPKIAL